MTTSDASLRESDIRPRDLLEGQRAAMAEDIAFLQKRMSSFVMTPCPSCGGNESRPAYTKHEFAYVSCAACDTFYMNPRPTGALLGEFYAFSKNYHYWNKYIFPASAEVRREKIFVPRVDMVLDLCETHQVRTDALLEVGAGFGLFCEELISRNVFRKVVAIEPTPDLAETVRSKHIEVIEKPVELVEFAADERFDVVVNFEVIEHLHAPYEFLKHCYRVLREGGLLIISCPNGAGFEVDVLGAQSDTIDHEHLNYFNPASLRALLARAGFEPLQVLTPGKLDADIVRNKVLEGSFSIDHDAFLQRVLLKEWDRLGPALQTFLQEQNLSSNMVAVARKPGS